MKKTMLLTAAVIAALALPAQGRDRRGGEVTLAVFSLNDFHGAFVRNDYKDIPGAAPVWQTLDSLKRVYPHNLTVSGGDIFGGSYFYNATHGALLPTFFNGLGIRLSALGNHEFDDGQAALARRWRDVKPYPAGWDISFVCANVRDSSGSVPAFAQPYAQEQVEIGGKTVRVGFVGLIASSTPQQASKSKLVGLTFDGNYPAVLDSVKRLAGYNEAVGKANVRILLTHIGTKMENGRPAWDDIDAAHLAAIDDPAWDAIISAHSHQPVSGTINARHYPIVQGKWHGEYICILKFHLDRRTLKVRRVESELCPVRGDVRLGPGPQRLQQQVDSLLQHTKTRGGTPLGERLTVAPTTLVHDRDDKYRQTFVGTLVCRSYAEAYRRAAHLSPADIVIGASHFGSIRASFVKGPVSVLDVGETLPFANALRAYRLTGRQLTALVDFGFHNQRFGWLQTGWLKPTLDADRHVTALAYVGPDGVSRPIGPDTPCILVADEFIVNGGDGYAPAFFPAAQEVKADMPATTDAFINYLKTFTTLPTE